MIKNSLNIFLMKEKNKLGFVDEVLLVSSFGIEVEWFLSNDSSKSKSVAFSSKWNSWFYYSKEKNQFTNILFDRVQILWLLN